MELVLKRKESNKNETLGELYIDGEFECFILEDEFREVKVKHETRIPQGKYEITLRTYGGHYERYTTKFRKWHKGMLQLMNVPNFTDILIHIGNKDSDSSGCLLTGKQVNKDNDDKITLLYSTIAYKQMYEKVIKAFDRKEQVYITIKDEDKIPNTIDNTN